MSTPSPLRIVIPGGSGQIGQIIARHFHDQGHTVRILGRHVRPGPWWTTLWDARQMGSWANEINGADVVINLAGSTVNSRYSKANRRRIKESRVLTTELIGKAIAQAPKPPALWINASTASIYRHALDRPMDEATGEIGGDEPRVPSSWRFSIDVATSWERTLFEAPTPRTRRIALRSSVVLSPDKGGIFDVLLGLVRAGLGGKAGAGDQFVSWIDDVDFLRAIEFLLAHKELDGPINVCSPNPLPNREFMRDLRKAWGAPVGLPAANWMLAVGAVFLRTETELVLKSRRVVPGRLLTAGFEFSHPDWATAAKDLVRRWRELRSKAR
jgi:uncharacterized protein (TIGR01777 family)